MTTTTKKSISAADLQASPIHGIRPVFEQPQLVALELLEVDETNPGLVSASLRDQRRDPAIRDSYDIIGGIVYPLVVCQHEDPEKRARGVCVINDGHGRYRQAKARGQEKMWVIIYPPLTLEQRILLRETLGAAQEPFDPVSVMLDLQLLASKRGLDLHNVADVEDLLRTLPEKVQRYRKDLLMLTRWDAVVLGESYKKDSSTLGLDKVRELTRVVDAVAKQHPDVYKDLGGDQGVTKKLARMYLDKKFSTGARSQESIRKVASAVRELESDDPLVKRFFNDELDYAVLTPYAKTRASAAGPRELREVCQELAGLLVGADPSDLNDGERRSLAALQALIDGLLK